MKKICHKRTTSSECSHLVITFTMVSNSISKTIMINQSLTYFTETLILLTIKTLKSKSMVIMKKRKAHSTRMYLILNSKDILKYLIQIMKTTWFFINALRQLTIMICKEKEFQTMKLGKTQSHHQLTSRDGHRPQLFTMIILQ